MRGHGYIRMTASIHATRAITSHPLAPVPGGPCRCLNSFHPLLNIDCGRSPALGFAFFLNTQRSDNEHTETLPTQNDNLCQCQYNQRPGSSDVLLTCHNSTGQLAAAFVHAFTILCRHSFGQHQQRHGTHIHHRGRNALRDPVKKGFPFDVLSVASSNQGDTRQGTFSSTDDTDDRATPNGDGKELSTPIILQGNNLNY